MYKQQFVQLSPTTCLWCWGDLPRKGKQWNFQQTWRSNSPLNYRSRLLFPHRAVCIPLQWSRWYSGQLSIWCGEGSVYILHGSLWFPAFNLLAPCSTIMSMNIQHTIHPVKGYNRAHNWADLPPQCSMSSSNDIHKGPNDSSCPKWIHHRGSTCITTYNVLCWLYSRCYRLQHWLYRCNTLQYWHTLNS